MAPYRIAPKEDSRVSAILRQNIEPMSRGKIRNRTSEKVTNILLVPQAGADCLDAAGKGA